MKQEIKDKLKKLHILYQLYYNISNFASIKKKRTKNKFFKREGTLLLQKFSQTLNDNNILFWLEFGTLLGFYREHDFIKHDDDLDMGAFLKDASKIREVLTDNGFVLIREFHVINDGGLEECYKFKHTSIDVFYFRNDSESTNLYCNSFRPMFKIEPKHLNKQVPFKVRKITIPNTTFIKVEYKNCVVHIPEDIKLHLQTHYGTEFMIPDPNFDATKTATNITCYTYESNPGFGILTEKW